MTTTKGGKTSFKDLVGVIRKSPALMIVVVAIIGFVLYLLIKHGASNNSSTTAADSSTLPTTNAQGSYYQSQEPLVEPIIFQQQPSVGSTPMTGVVQTPGETTVTIPSNPQGSPVPAASGPATTTGLLGPNANINFQNRTQHLANGLNVPLGIPASDPLTQGTDNRVWYTQNGQPYLLTSGYGGAVPGSPGPQSAGTNGTIPSNNAAHPDIRQNNYQTQTTSNT